VVQAGNPQPGMVKELGLSMHLGLCSFGSLSAASLLPPGCMYSVSFPLSPKGNGTINQNKMSDTYCMQGTQELHINTLRKEFWKNFLWYFECAYSFL